MTPRDHLEWAERWLMRAEAMDRGDYAGTPGNQRKMELYTQLSLAHSQCAGAHVSVHLHELAVQVTENGGTVEPVTPQDFGGVPRGT